MTHSFNTEIAKEIGVNGAIIYDSISFWCAKNKANDKHFHDGKYWTYNSLKAFKELFPYLGIDQIKRALKKLEEKGYISSGEYNKIGYDRTKWYAGNHLHDVVVSTNGDNGNNQPIPDTIPVTIILHTLNEELGKNFRATNKTISLIKARTKEGFTLEDFKHVIKVKSSEWKTDEKMSKFLRPETLFGTKFEGYLNQKEKSPKKKGFNYED